MNARQTAVHQGLARLLVVCLCVVGITISAYAQEPFPSAKCETLRALEAKFGHLNRGSDEDRRQFARIAAEQFAFSWPDEGWGSKASSPRNPQTKDALARKNATGFVGWDVVGGGDRRVTCQAIWHDLSGQHFIPVTPVNHLGVAQPQPPPPPDCGECERALANMTGLEAITRHERDHLAREFARVNGELAAARAQIEHLQRQLANVQCVPHLSPGWVGRFGVRASCAIAPLVNRP